MLPHPARMCKHMRWGLMQRFPKRRVLKSGCPAAIERPLSGGQIASRLRRLGVGRTFSRAVRADFLQPICLQLATTVRCSLETCHWIAGPHRCLDDCNRSATDRPSRGHERQQPLQSRPRRSRLLRICDIALRWTDPPSPPLFALLYDDCELGETLAQLLFLL